MFHHKTIFVSNHELNNAEHSCPTVFFEGSDSPNQSGLFDVACDALLFVCLHAASGDAAERNRLQRVRNENFGNGKQKCCKNGKIWVKLIRKML